MGYQLMVARTLHRHTLDLMKAKEVHAALRARLSDACKSAGFSRFARTASMWCREESDAFQIFRLHLDTKFGYIKPIGGRIFLRAWRSRFLHPQPDGAPPLILRDLLSYPRLHRMIEIEAPIAKKILAGDWAFLQSLNEEMRTVFDRTRRNLESAAAGIRPPNAMIDEMPYVDSEDVARWADFLADAIPDISAAIPNHPG